MWLFSHVRNLRIPPSERGGSRRVKRARLARRAMGRRCPAASPCPPASAGPLPAPISVPRDPQGMMYRTQITPSLNNL